MKRLLALLSFLLCFSMAYSQSYAIKKVINKYDAKYLTREGGFEKPEHFWATFLKYDKRNAYLEMANNKKDESLNNSLMALSYKESTLKDDNRTTFNYDSIVNKLVVDLGMENLAKECPIIIDNNYSINASMNAFGQMRINYGCFVRLPYYQLLAVCAHEMAHYICSHVIMRVWKSAKKYKINRMWADIGASLFIGATAATATYGSYYGQDTSHFNKIIANAGVIYEEACEYADDATIKYSYRYSRGEESEADIIAYRFMEQNGYGGENVYYMLKTLYSIHGDTPSSKYNNHPSLSFRMEVISAMMKGYSGKKK